MRPHALVAAALAAATLAGCGDALAPRAEAGAAAAGAHERGRAIYNFRCYFCHGYAGDARTVAATYLEPPPRDFTAGGLDAQRIRHALRHGRDGTAMRPFAGTLDDGEIALVADFVVAEFVVARAPNTRYHTAANGWPDHERTRAAWPFATGALAIDAPAATLDATQAAGLRLFLAACVSCHDRSRATAAGPAFDPRPVSYPPDGSDCVTCHDRVRHAAPGAPPPPKPISYHGHTVAPEDAAAQAAGREGDPYAAHDLPRRLAGLTAQEKRGERLYLANCAFCHAADGTARHWIGRFLEPHPRDLTDRDAMAGMTRPVLAQRIRDGVPGASMPAWRGVLAPRDIDAVAAYVARAFVDGGAGRADGPAATSRGR